MVPCPRASARVSELALLLDHLGAATQGEAIVRVYASGRLDVAIATISLEGAGGLAAPLAAMRDAALGSTLVLVEVDPDKPAPSAGFVEHLSLVTPDAVREDGWPVHLQRELGLTPPQRAHTRHPSRLPCALSWGGRERAGVVSNVSAGGLFVSLPQPPIGDTPVTCDVSLPYGKRLSLRGVIRHSVAEARSPRPGAGVSFAEVDVPPDVLKALLDLLARVGRRTIVLAGDVPASLAQALDAVGAFVVRARTESDVVAALTDDLAGVDLLVVAPGAGDFRALVQARGGERELPIVSFVATSKDRSVGKTLSVHAPADEALRFVADALGA